MEGEVGKRPGRPGGLKMGCRHFGGPRIRGIEGPEASGLGAAFLGPLSPSPRTISVLPIRRSMVRRSWFTAARGLTLGGTVHDPATFNRSEKNFSRGFFSSE